MNYLRERILYLSNITKDFPGTRALDEVTFDLYKGEVHCLVGENGAGKSTLIKILSGAEKPDRGKIIVFDKEYNKLEPKDSINLGISTIYQDVDLVDTLSVADNIFLGNEIQNKYGLIDAKNQMKKATEIMDILSINIHAELLVEELSLAQKQMLQIVKALHRDARIIIMDEPTASLGQEETEALMKLIRNVTAKEVGVIYISHYIEEIFAIGDRITVLKDGKNVNTYEKESVHIGKIIKDVVGREASLFYKRKKVNKGKTLLQVKNFSRSDAVKNVSFDVKEGEIFGIGGIVGSGRTELINLLFGVDKRDTGEMCFDDHNITINTPRESIKNGFCMIGENRSDDGLFFVRPVKENIGVVHTERSSFLLKLKREASLVKKMIKRLRIDVSSLQEEVGYLSGGNQQKSIMARWLLSNAKVFIFDEPTKGVDIGSKEEIYKLMIELVQEGKAIIMISSDMPELLSMSDRIGIMRNGEMLKIIEAEKATEEGVLKEFLGLNVTE